VKNKIPNSLPLQRRAATIEQTPDAESRTVTFALSSEEPARQWFGNEVLKHGKENIRTARLKSGTVPLLFNHDPDKHLGVVNDYEIKDGVLRVTATFGNSPLAQEKLQDVRDGILKSASAGYRIHKMVRTEDEDNPNAPDNVDVTDWEPYDASLVTVPADSTVGVGRAATEEFPLEVEDVLAQRGLTAVNSAISETTEKTMSTTAVVTDNGAAELARRDRILAIASDKDFSKYVTTDEARKAIAEGVSADVFGEQVSRKIIDANDITKVGTVGSNLLREASPKGNQTFSVVRLLRSLVNDAKPGMYGKEEAGFEREVCTELKKRMKIDTQGTIMPLDTLRALGTSAISATTGQIEISSEAAAVSTVTRPEVIELLRNRPRAIQLGARTLGGLTGVIRLPRQSAAGTGYWVTEGANVTASDLAMDYISVTPHRYSLQSGVDIELLAQASPDVEGLMRADMAKVRLIGLDLASLTGSGSSGQPQGLLGASGLTLLSPTGTAFSGGSGGSPLDFADVILFETTVAAANADAATSGWMFTPEVRGQLKGTPKFASGYAIPIWGDSAKDPMGLEEGPLGYKAAVTNQLPKNGTASGVTGSVLHTAIFGDWSQLVFADWGAVEVIVDPYTQAGNGAIVLTQRSLHDIAIRHIAAFAANKKIAIS
jgi:HK97 family phage major capsid protein/HK97 family phage prohead protease